MKQRAIRNSMPAAKSTWIIAISNYQLTLRKTDIDMRDYKLGFISNETIFNHVKQTVELYRTHINLKDFNKNIIDPIKLTFDAKVYGKTLDEIIESESIRQIDKTNTNHIGYFHQNLFRYAGNGWEVPEAGFDVVNERLHIFAELKNKHNTMNSRAADSVYPTCKTKSSMTTKLRACWSRLSLQNRATKNGFMTIFHMRKYAEYPSTSSMALYLAMTSHFSSYANHYQTY